MARLARWMKSSGTIEFWRRYRELPQSVGRATRHTYQLWRENPRAPKLQFAELAPKYPIAITRSVEAARDWIRVKARGTERYGIVASSRAMRLKPHAIDIRVAVDPVQYFLNDRDDVRSSYYLEDAATEFQVQGLELDWACVTWDADFRFNGSDWDHHDFRGSRWCKINNADNRVFLRNAYRVRGRKKIRGVTFSARSLSH